MINEHLNFKLKSALEQQFSNLPHTYVAFKINY